MMCTRGMERQEGHPPWAQTRDARPSSAQPRLGRLATVGREVAVTCRVKHDALTAVKTVTIRDLRQRWPKAEAMLEHEKEILVTRDGKPVAKLVRVREPAPARRRLDPHAHARWQARVAGRRIVRWLEEFPSPTAGPVTSAPRVLYLDSNALLKLLWPEPESEGVRHQSNW